MTILLFIPRLVLTVIYRLAIIGGAAMALIAAVCSVGCAYLRRKP